MHRASFVAECMQNYLFPIGFRNFHWNSIEFWQQSNKILCPFMGIEEKEHFQGSHIVFHWDRAILRCNSLEIYFQKYIFSWIEATVNTTGLCPFLRAQEISLQRSDLRVKSWIHTWNDSNRTTRHARQSQANPTPPHRSAPPPSGMSQERRPSAATDSRQTTTKRHSETKPDQPNPTARGATHK